MNNTMDCESLEVKGFDFSDQTVRKGFIKKVYSILILQLSITMGFIAWFLFHEPTRHWVQNNLQTILISMGVVLVSVIILGCFGDVRRKSPMNYILLFLITLGESYLVACAASILGVQEVLLAAGITIVVCLAITLFAFQTKWDFTIFGGFLVVAITILLVFGVAVIFLYDELIILAFTCLAALLFSFYLLYDTKLMIGGKHRYSISPEEYVFAALNLYFDIIIIFLYILKIIALLKR